MKTPKAESMNTQFEYKGRKVQVRENDSVTLYPDVNWIVSIDNSFSFFAYNETVYGAISLAKWNIDNE
jgi:hypothetical protein